jgi:hypothetical protein
VARRLYRQQEVDGVYRLDDGAVLDDVFHGLQALGVMALREEVHGVAIQRAMVADVQSVLRSGLKTRFGMDRMNALPARLCSDEALMQLVGLNAPPVRQGLGQRGATTRPGERTPGPSSPATVANHIVQLNRRDLAWVFKGAMRAVAKAGVLAKQVTGSADGTDWQTTARDRGCGQVTRKVRIADKQGRGHEMEVTVYGWKVRLLSDALTKRPLGGTVGQSQAHATH